MSFTQLYPECITNGAKSPDLESWHISARPDLMVEIYSATQEQMDASYSRTLVQMGLERLPLRHPLSLLQEACMLSKCANPDCNTPFHYLRDGRLYQIDTADSAEPGDSLPFTFEPKRPHKVEFFWLCGHCSTSMTLSFQRGKGVVAVPLPAPITRRAAAS